MFKIGEHLAMLQARTWLSRALSSSFSSGGQAPSNVLYKSTHSERRRPPLSIMSCPLGAQQQTRRMLQRLSNDGTMNGLTDARPLRRPCSAYYEVCFINPRNIRAEASGVVNKRACTAYCVSLHTVAACLRKQLISHVPL